LKQQLEALLERIHQACDRSGRDPRTVRLVAVSKTVPAERVRQAVEAGVQTLGENYIQEAREKIPQLSDRVNWHFTGHLQKNKAKFAAALFSWVHTVDSPGLAEALNRRAEMESRHLNVLIEVNVGKEATKSGVLEEALIPLAEHVSGLASLSLKGLMVIPPITADPEAARAYFIRTRQLAEQVAAQKIPGVSMDELSMGMTSDFEIAIEEGATMVRVGTAIFGARNLS